MQSVCGLAHQCSRFVPQTVDVGEARQPGRHIEGASAQQWSGRSASAGASARGRRAGRSAGALAGAPASSWARAHAGVLRGRHDDLQAREARQFLLADIESREVSELELYRACDVYDVQRSAADRASVLATQLTRSF